MIAVLWAGLAILLIVVISEYLGRTGTLRGEAARKLVHIVGGVFIAFWPFFMSFKTIELLSLAAVVAVAAVRYLKLFGSLHDVERKSAGDVMFALGALASAVIAQDKWIFAAAILELSLADGLAAIVGTRFKSKQLLHIKGERRTLVGTLTFFIVSLLILAWLTVVAPSGLHDLVIYIPWLAIQATAVEFVSIWGTDNILVPSLMALVLRGLR